MSLDFSAGLGIINISEHSDVLKFSKAQESHFFHSALSFQNDADQSDLTHLDISSFGEESSFYRYNTINVIQIKGQIKLCLTRCLSTFSTPTDEFMFFADSQSDKDLKELHDQLNKDYFKSFMFDASDDQFNKLMDYCNPHFLKIGFDDLKIAEIKRSILCLVFAAEQYSKLEKSKSSLFIGIDEVPLLSHFVTASFKLKNGDLLIDSLVEGNNAILNAVVSGMKEGKKLSDFKFRVELDFKKMGSEHLNLKMNVNLANGKYLDYVFHDHFGIITEYSDVKKLETDLKLVASSFTNALVKKAETIIASDKVSQTI